MKKKIAILMVLMMGLLALAGCSSDNTSKMVGERNTLAVTVQDIDGNALNGATVTADKSTEVGETGDDSNTTTLDLYDGTYEITVSVEDYKDEIIDVVMNGSDTSITAKLARDLLGDFVFISSDGENDLNIDGDNNVNEGNIHIDTWGTWTDIKTEDITYNDKDAWQLTTPESWGTVLAFMGDLYNENQTAEFPIDLTADSMITFDVATTGDYDTLAVKVVGDNEKEITIDSFDESSTEWQTVEISTDQFSSVDPANVKQIAIIASGGTAGDSKVYITDYKVTNYKVAQ